MLARSPSSTNVPGGSFSSSNVFAFRTRTNESGRTRRSSRPVYILARRTDHLPATTYVVVATAYNFASDRMAEIAKSLSNRRTTSVTFLFKSLISLNASSFASFPLVRRHGRLHVFVRRVSPVGSVGNEQRSRESFTRKIEILHWNSGRDLEIPRFPMKQLRDRRYRYYSGPPSPPSVFGRFEHVCSKFRERARYKPNIAFYDRG